MVGTSMSKDDDHRGGLMRVGDIPIDVPGVGRTLTARRQAHHFIAAMLVTVIPPAVRDVASFL